MIKTSIVLCLFFKCLFAIILLDTGKFRFQMPCIYSKTHTRLSVCSVWKPASTYPPMLVSSSQFATVLIITKQLSSHLLLFIDFLLFSKFCDAFAFVRLFLFAKTHHFTLPHFYSCSTINVWSRQALFCAYSLVPFCNYFGWTRISILF